jgi:hypothetical protein
MAGGDIIRKEFCKACPCHHKAQLFLTGAIGVFDYPHKLAFVYDGYAVAQGKYLFKVIGNKEHTGSPVPLFKEGFPYKKGGADVQAP